jgi:2',3'-cyclic-nucleotide 2'-phosphodiesterase/3'-nucleotidase
MNQLGYDAANIGNHEFNYGLDFCAAHSKGLISPMSTPMSMWMTRTPIPSRPSTHFTPYVLLDRQLVDAQGKSHCDQGGRDWFCPAANHAVGQGTPGGQGGRRRDIAGTARKYVPLMRARARNW